MNTELQKYYQERKYAITFIYPGIESPVKKIHFYNSKNPDGAVAEGFIFYAPAIP